VDKIGQGMGQSRGVKSLNHVLPFWFKCPFVLSSCFDYLISDFLKFILLKWLDFIQIKLAGLLYSLFFDLRAYYLLLWWLESNNQGEFGTILVKAGSLWWYSCQTQDLLKKFGCCWDASPWFGKPLTPLWLWGLNCPSLSSNFAWMTESSWVVVI